MKYISLAATCYDGSISLLIFQWKYGAVRRSKHWKTVSDAIEIKIEISIENVHLIELNAFFRILMLNRDRIAWYSKYFEIQHENICLCIYYTHTHTHWQHGWMYYAIVQVYVCVALSCVLHFITWMFCILSRISNASRFYGIHCTTCDSHWTCCHTTTLACA